MKATTYIRAAEKSDKAIVAAMRAAAKIGGWPYPHSEVPAYDRAILAGDWVSVSELADQTLAETTRQIQIVGKVAKAANPAFAFVQAATTDTIEGPEGKLNDAPEWSAFRSDMASQMEMGGMSSAQVDSFMSTFGNMNAHLVTIGHAARGLVLLPVGEARSALLTQLRRHAGALFAQVVARLNGHTTTVAAHPKTIAATLSAQSAVFASLDPAGGAAATGRAAQAMVERGVADLTAGWPELAAQLDAESATSPTAKHRMASIDVSTIIGNAIALQVLGHYVGWLSACGHGYDQYDALMLDLAHANEAVTDVRVVPISKLVVSTRAVTTEGWIRNVASASAQMSVVELADGDRSITLQIPQLSVDMFGLEVNTACRASGPVARDDSGNLVMQVQAPGSTPPSDRTGYLLWAGQSLFSARPSSLPLWWAWRPGKTGLAYRLSVGYWFS